MYSPVFLRNENQLNKVLKNQKKTREEMAILFVSLWDKLSQKLVRILRNSKVTGGVPLYVVDSFTMPHAFVIFNTSKIPHLVKLNKKGVVQSEDYLSQIYSDLKI